jgi:hypothetical protein
MRLPGRATPEGTRRYLARLRERHGEAFAKQLGQSGLWAGRIGFGGYRIDDGTPAHEQALEKALVEGANLIDTSTNYSGGASERLVGRSIARLVERGQLSRDEVIVVSKIGYVQGDNLEIAKRRRAEGKPFEEMVEYQEGCWHCIHPAWLADQLDRSLDRLGLETLDLCLLHNPEYFLSHAENLGEVSAATRSELYSRMERAFAFLEAQVTAGRIGGYGVSSNTLAQSADGHPEATELERMIAAARRAGGDDHHFRIVQLPLNLLESEGALAPVVEGTSVLEYAQKQGLGVLVNRPLNAIAGQDMVRLSEPPEVPRSANVLSDELDRLSALERRFEEELAAQAPLAGKLSSSDLFRWGRELGSLVDRIGSVEHYEQVARGQILPHVGQALALVERSLTGSAREPWMRWRGEYIRALESALSTLRAEIARRAEERVGSVKEALEPLVPAAQLSAPLSQKALWVLLGTPGVDVVLLGMRQSAYVDDAFAVFPWAPPRDAAAIYRALQS